MPQLYDMIRRRKGETRHAARRPRIDARNTENTPSISHRIRANSSMSKRPVRTGSIPSWPRRRRGFRVELAAVAERASPAGSRARRVDTAGWLTAASWRSLQQPGGAAMRRERRHAPSPCVTGPR